LRKSAEDPNRVPDGEKSRSVTITLFEAAIKVSLCHHDSVGCHSCRNIFGDIVHFTTKVVKTIVKVVVGGVG
jgi:hypothetical protein